MERNYETVCIVKPDVGDDVIKAVIEKASAVVESANGTVARLDDWGRRRLAYPIAKKNEGYYFILTYTSESSASKEMERQLRLNEDVLRYQTVHIEELPEPVAEEPAEPEAATTETTPAADEEKGGGDE